MSTTSKQSATVDAQVNRLMYGIGFLILAAGLACLLVGRVSL
jgi:hypothetical protein